MTELSQYGSGSTDRLPSAGELDLEERGSLRRVTGLSTELADVTEVEYRQLRLERVVLVGVWTEGSAEHADNSLTELAALAETAGSQVLDGLIQRRSRPDPATYIGSGKVDELRDVVRAAGADTVICDGELVAVPAAPPRAGRQGQGGRPDRADPRHLRPARQQPEGKAQVELAQLEYLLPRLRGWGETLSRQVGGRRRGRRRRRSAAAPVRRSWRPTGAGSATGSPSCAARSQGCGRCRQHQRAERRATPCPVVAIAGYTNAGKSSLLNRLTGAGVLVEDALFATLDPTTRRTAAAATGGSTRSSDTVGFVRHLPHQLVEAFRSTLEEVGEADLVVHVVDGTHPDPEEQVRAVREVLAEVGADRCPSCWWSTRPTPPTRRPCCGSSASGRTRSSSPRARGVGIDGLREADRARLPRPGRRGPRGPAVRPG